MQIAEYQDGRLVAYDQDQGEWVPISREAANRYLQAQEPISERASQMAAQDVGPLEAAKIGFGKAAHDVVTGLEDLYYRAIGDKASQEALRAEQQQAEQAYSGLREERPIATAVGESVPFMAAGAGAGVGGSLASALLRQGAAGAALGGTMYAPTLGERGTRAATEGALGAVGEGVGRGIGRMVRPGMETVGAPSLRVIEEASGEGYRTLPASYSSSKTFRNIIEGGLDSTPTGAAVLDEVRSNNQRLLNRHAAASFGEQSDFVSDSVLADAHERIGRMFNEVIGENTRYHVDDAFIDSLDTLEQERIAPHLVGAEDPVRQLVDRALGMMTRREGGEVTGREIQAEVTRLGNAARSAMRNNPDLAFSLYDMQGMLLDMVRTQAGQQRGQMLDTARSQWRNLVNVESAVDPEIGDVKAGTLAQRLKYRDKPGYLRGANRSPLYTGTRFMARVQPEPKSSGTAERSWLQKTIGNALTYGSPALGFTAGDPAAVGLGLAAPFAVPYVGARAYVAPQSMNWLTGQPNPLVQDVLGAAGIGTMQVLSDLSGDNQ